MPISTYQSYIGIAKEVTKQTAASAVDFIPVKTMAPVDHQAYLQDSGMRGSQVASYGQVPGVTWAEYDFTGDVLPDTFGYPLAGVLGDVVVTGAAAPFAHAIAVKNTGDGQPSSYTITDNNGITTRQFAGCQFSDVGITFAADGLLEYSAKASGAISVIGTAPTKTYTPVGPIANWRGAILVGGAVDLTVIDGSCDIKRPIDVIHTVDGSATPYRFWAGPVNVSGKLVVVAETEAAYLNYLNNTQPSLDISWMTGTGAAQVGLTLHMSKAAYLTGNVNRGKDYIAFDVTYEAVANITDVGATAGYSPIKATITSAKPTGTYA